MNYSSQYLSVIVLVIAELLKWSGIEVGSEALTTTVLTLCQVAGALWILKERVKKGGVNWLGVKQ